MASGSKTKSRTPVPSDGNARVAARGRGALTPSATRASACRAGCDPRRHARVGRITNVVCPPPVAGGIF
jgi:hypothetical protein